METETVVTDRFRFLDVQGVGRLLGRQSELVFPDVYTYLGLQEVILIGRWSTDEIGQTSCQLCFPEDTVGRRLVILPVCPG